MYSQTVKIGIARDHKIMSSLTRSFSLQSKFKLQKFTFDQIDKKSFGNI